MNMERLSGRKIRKCLGGKGGGIRLRFVKKATSTFDVANPQVVVAARQTNGRGRGDKRFFSPSGGIYIAIKTNIKPLLTIKAAVGVIRVMEKYGIEPRVKWVNDIFVSGKKACGILTVQDPQNCNNAIIGIGINYCTRLFPDGLNAISLFENGKGINEFAAQIIKGVLRALNEDCLEIYKTHLLNLGADIMIANVGRVTFEDVNNEGHLVYFDGEKRGIISYGEIELLKQY